MENKEDPPLKQIRTFQGDVADALKKQKESLVSIQRVEHLKKDSRKTDGVSKEIFKKRLEFFYLLLGSFLLLTLGSWGGWYAYQEFKEGAPTQAVPANRLIPINTEVVLDVTETSRGSFVETLSGALENIADRETRHIVLRKVSVEEVGLLSTSEFLEILESQAPSNLVRAFDPIFMLGAYGQSTFFIIKLTSFENAFAGMLAWEGNLGQDLGPLLGTRELSRNLSPEAVFVDITDQNKDIRALMVGEEPFLIYSFLDNNTLIITDKIETLRVVIERLTREKLSR